MPKIRTREPLLYALAGTLFIAFAWLAYLDNLPGISLKTRAVVCASLLAGYGGFFLMCAALAFTLARRGGSLGALFAGQTRSVVGALGEMRAWLTGRSDGPGEIFTLLAIILLGLFLRTFFLAQPMRLDESYTFLYYLNEGRDPFLYNVPNNHVFHTLLAKLTVLAGGVSPVVIRLPAFLAGVLCIPASFFAAKAFHRNAGLLAALGMAVFPYMVLYSSMARGYSLIVLLTLCLLLVGRFHLEKPSAAGCILISLVSALGLFTIPTMAFPLAGFYLWMALALLLKERNLPALLRDFLLPTLTLTTLLTVFFYTPTLVSSNGAGAIFSNQYVDARSWDDFSRHIQPHVRQIISDFFRDVPTLAKYAAFFLVLAGLFDVARRREWDTLLLAPSIILGGLVIFFAKQAIPFVRSWIYLIPFFLLFADIGYTYLTQTFAPRFKIVFHAALLITGLAFAGSLVSENAITKYTDTGSFLEAQTVARYLKPLLTGDEFIGVMDTANFPLYYYLCAEHAPPQKKNINPATVKRYYVVQESWYKLSDLTSQPAEKIFVFGDATVYTAVLENEPIWPGFVFECRGG